MRSHSRASCTPLLIKCVISAFCIKKGPWILLGSLGGQPWDFFGRNDAKAETPVLWPPHVKSWDSDAGRDWGQEEKGTTEDEMAGWHHWLDGRESGWTLGVGDRQGGLACCNSWGRKESVGHDWVTELNWTLYGASSMAQQVRNLSAVQETWVSSLDQEDAMEEENGNLL